MCLCNDELYLIDPEKENVVSKLEKSWRLYVLLKVIDYQGKGWI